MPVQQFQLISDLRVPSTSADIHPSSGDQILLELCDQQIHKKNGFSKAQDLQ